MLICQYAIESREGSLCLCSSDRQQEESSESTRERGIHFTVGYCDDLAKATMCCSHDRSPSRFWAIGGVHVLQSETKKTDN